MSELRTISEQELKDILDKHDKWLKNIAIGAKANLSYANLRSANLSSADLRYANLSYADLRSANLRSADLNYANLNYANLSYADLRSANLRSANLRSADLSSADLRSADLNYANLSYANIIVFQCQRHKAFYTFDGTLRIGCVVMPITEWDLGFEEIGKKNEYTDFQIKAYGSFIKQCLEMFRGME